jgi:hypothetical protein
MGELAKANDLSQISAWLSCNIYKVTISESSLLQPEVTALHKEINN